MWPPDGHAPRPAKVRVELRRRVDVAPEPAQLREGDDAGGPDQVVANNRPCDAFLVAQAGERGWLQLEDQVDVAVPIVDGRTRRAPALREVELVVEERLPELLQP